MMERIKKTLPTLMRILVVVMPTQMRILLQLNNRKLLILLKVITYYPYIKVTGYLSVCTEGSFQPLNLYGSHVAAHRSWVGRVKRPNNYKPFDYIILFCKSEMCDISYDTDPTFNNKIGGGGGMNKYYDQCS